MTRKYAVLDTNMVVLLTVGMVDLELISSHKRTRAYNKDDFGALTQLIGASRGALLCPNVASEAHNIVAHSRTVKDGRFEIVLRQIVSNSEEVLISAKQAVNRPEYSHLGITDTTLLLVAGTEGVLITGDALLHVAALTAGLDSFNIFHIKETREGL